MATDRRSPVEATKLRFTPGVVLTIVAICISIFGSQFAATSGLKSDASALKSDVRDLKTTVDSQIITAAASSKLQDERSSALTLTISKVDAKVEMQRLKMDTLTEQATKLMSQKGGK